MTQKLHSESGGSFVRHLFSSISATIVLVIICCGIYPLIVWGLGQALFPARANGSLVKRDGSFTTKDDQAVGSSLLGQSFTFPGYFHPRPSAAGSGYDPSSSGGSNLGPLSDKLLNGVTNAATTQPTTQPESVAYDGVRLRTLHYAMDNGLSFKLYNLKPDGTRDEVPLAKFTDAQGNLNDVALIDAFPHPASDAADRVVLVAGDFRKADGSAVLIPSDAVTASASGLDPHISPDNARMQARRVADARHVPVERVLALLDQHTDNPSFGLLGDPGVNVLMANLALDAAYPVPAPPATAPTTAPVK